MDRRDFYTLGGLLRPVACARGLTALHLETNESPFFEHYHQLSIPVKALVNPAKALVLQTSAVDEESMDEKGFEDFIRSSKLDAEKLSRHSHAVSISIEQLKRIAGGERNVEVRVISPAGNYVHNFLITAYQSTLAPQRRRSKK